MRGGGKHQSRTFSFTRATGDAGLAHPGRTAKVASLGLTRISATVLGRSNVNFSRPFHSQFATYVHILYKDYTACFGSTRPVNASVHDQKLRELGHYNVSQATPVHFHDVDHAYFFFATQAADPVDVRIKVSPGDGSVGGAGSSDSLSRRNGSPSTPSTSFAFVVASVVLTAVLPRRPCRVVGHRT